MKSENKILTQTTVQLLQNGHPIEIKALGYSMFPLLRPNHRLVVEPIEPQNCKKGDIIVFIAYDRLIAHRLVEINCHQLICRGDATLHRDEPITYKQLLGKVTARKNHNKTKHLTTLLQKWYGRLILFSHPLSALLFIKMIPIASKKLPS